MRLTLSIVLGLVTLGVTAAAAAPISLHVQYLTADRVYIDGGGRFGLAPGDRLQVVRGQEVAAVLEVVYAATHSASCRIVEGTAELRAGDTVTWDAPTAPRARLASNAQAELRAPGVEAPQVRPAESQAPVSQPPPRPRVPMYTRSEPEQRALRSSVSGSLTFDWEQFTDDSGFGRDFDRTAVRLSLRGRNIGGMPLQFRLRSSTRTLDRVVRSDGSSSISDTRDRLYEMSLAYEPPEGRFAFRLGRLRLGRYAGAGTIDGVSAEARLGKVFRLGVFGGSRSDISDFGYDGDRTSYGVTTRWTAGEPGKLRELLVAGVREDGVLDVSREYVAVQTRLSGGRWSFYQRAEIDLNNGWREELSGTANQLSTLFVNASTRISDRARFSLSYSRFERFRTEDTRFIPEELFDDSQRQGLRARLRLGRSRGLNVTLSAGLRERDGDDEDATSAGLGVRHNNLFGKRFSLGLNVLTFSNRFSDGTTAILRASKRLRAGHRFSLTAGFRTIDDLIRVGEQRETQWFRLGGWFELPGNLFARAELEVSSGDDLEGERVLVGVGYRL
jgi:hypothetical protein